MYCKMLINTRTIAPQTILIRRLIYVLEVGYSHRSANRLAYVYYWSFTQVDDDNADTYAWPMSFINDSKFATIRTMESTFALSELFNYLPQQP